MKLRHYLKLFTQPGDWILDPFTGSGTTNLVARGLDRNSIGIDNLMDNVTLAKQYLSETLKHKDSYFADDTLTF
jgi:DNA modification methylase